MRRRSRWWLALVAAPTVVVFGLAAVPGLAAGSPARLLTANVLSGLNGLGGVAPDPATPMQIGVALARPDPAGEVALYQRLYQPGGAQYRAFLTPGQFNQRFGVSSAAYRQTANWLRAGGLSVDASVTSHDYLLATGTVAQIDRTFGTTIRRFQSGTTGFLANVTAPSIPRNLPISSVIGLNTFQRFATPAHPAPTAPPSAGLPNVFASTPQDLWSVYQQPAAYRGAGQTLAVFGSGASAGAISDLAQFEKEHQLPAVAVTVHHVGPGPFTDTTGAVEWNIDTQAATGMAPDVKGLTLYFGANLVDATVEAMLTTWVNDPAGPAQADASFGECERTPLDPLLERLPGNISQDPNATAGIALGNNLEPVAEATLRQATIEGRTLFSSSGDNGSSCPVVLLPGLGAGNGVLNQIVPLTSYPASSQYAVAVGGTVLYTSLSAPGARVAEYAWPFSGGGDSLLIPAPAYQRGTPGLFGPCLATADGRLGDLGQPCRGVPDVAAQSGDALTNGYRIVAAGHDTEGAGTSLSSPLWAGMWARVNQSGGGAGYGFANPTIYRLGKNPATARRDFFDVTVGVNGLYAALPGWDYVSGFGAPRLANLIADAR
jgi:pseudomonalisin